MKLEGIILTQIRQLGELIPYDSIPVKYIVKTSNRIVKKMVIKIQMENGYKKVRTYLAQNFSFSSTNELRSATYSDYPKSTAPLRILRWVCPKAMLLRVLALAKNPRDSQHQHNPCKSSPRAFGISSGLLGHQICTWHTDTHASKTLIHTE